MGKINVCIQKIAGNEDIPLPQYMTNQAAGMDIFAAVAQEEIILPGGRKKIPTGIAIALPEGFEAQIRPRSGLAIKEGITLLNSPGTIDADYRGEIALIVINHGEKPFIIRRGRRRWQSRSMQPSVAAKIERIMSTPPLAAENRHARI